MEVPSADAFVRYFENIRGRTERVVACVPPDQLEWRPAPGAFSFGDLIRHLGAIERYIEGTMDRNDAVLFEEKMRSDSLLRMNVSLHEKVLAIVRMYHRRKLKIELQEVHHRIFNDPAKVTFRERMMAIFRNK